MPFAEKMSCTVEVCDINNMMDVAILDEIQMLGDRDRGWAWTRALLGVQVSLAREPSPTTLCPSTGKG